jgi:hypothetical protein
LGIPVLRRYGVPDLDDTRELELQLTGGWSADHDARQKHELACLRMAADCMQLVGDIQNPHLQRDFLELAKQLTAVAETTEAPALT